MGKETTILVVEDDADSRNLLRRLLKKQGYRVIVADNGAQGVAAHAQHQPDLVLMDVMMPVMDGYEATRRIKAASGERLVPVIFLTAVEDKQELARCLECGGDDFLTKPYNRTLLKARISNWEKKAQLSEQLRQQRDKLDFERRLIEEILERIRQSDRFSSEGLRYLLSPMETTAGDLLLAALRPDGVRHVFLGDFTGHGLPSALGAPTVSDIFYSMTAKGFSMARVLTEINAEINARLPVGMYLAACGVEVDPCRQRMWVWNGGLPDALLYRGERLLERITSHHVPMGILPRSGFNAEGQGFPFLSGERLFVYSDGMTEAASPEGRMLGQDALERMLVELIRDDHPLSWLEQRVHRHQLSEALQDDTTMVEIRGGEVCRLPLHYQEDRWLAGEDQESVAYPGWSMLLDLGPDALRSPELLPGVMEVMMEQTGLWTHRVALFTLVKELLDNAVDHGLLRLDTSLRRQSGGHALYQKLRERALRDLQEGDIHLNLAYFPAAGEEPPRVQVEVVDSGSGFDWERLSEAGGLALVRVVCQGRMQHFPPGNWVRAVYLCR